MEFLSSLYEFMLNFGSRPWFTIGSNEFTLFRLTGLIVILGFVWWFARVLESSLHRAAKKNNDGSLKNSNFYALSRIVRYTVWITGSFVGLNYLGFDLTTISLLGGAIGVGIGFGLQTIVSNFICGIILLIEKTLKVGDFVELESGVMGRVNEISMRYTRVTTNDLVDVIVPNAEFINGRVTNWSFDERMRRMHIPFGVAYGSDKSLVREAALAAARSIAGTIEDSRRTTDVWLVNFGESSLDFELVVWVSHDLMYSPARTRARYLWALEDELRARHIQIPFPQRDIHIRSDEAHRPAQIIVPDQA